MDEPLQRRSKWHQFSLSFLLLLMAIVAAFLAGRGSAQREFSNEIASLRQEIKAARPPQSPGGQPGARLRSPAPMNVRRPAEPETTQPLGIARVSPVKEMETFRDSDSIYLPLPAGKLKWSHATVGKSGYFYFGYQHELQWEFANSPHTRIQPFDGQPLKVTFHGQGTPGAESFLPLTSQGSAMKITVGDVWLARPVSDPTTIYVISIDRQEPGREEMTVKYATLKLQPDS